MNCPFCGAKMESEQDKGIMFAHPINTGSGCPMAGDYNHTMVWEKYKDAVEFLAKRLAFTLKVAS